MMTYEFYGKTEQEAIKKAMRDLDLKEGEFDIEMLDKEKVGFIFKKEMIKIKVYPHGKKETKQNIQIDDLTYDKITNFVTKIITKMGYSVFLKLESKEAEYIKIVIETDNPNILIGREGKNLDALQLLVNVYLSKLLNENGSNNLNKIILDIEDYRERVKSRFINLAISSLQKVKRSRHSVLLPLMNPFERRIIHTTLNRYNDIKTESEGDGNLKRIRISYVRNKYGNSHYNNRKETISKR